MKNKRYTNRDSSAPILAKLSREHTAKTTLPDDNTVTPTLHFLQLQNHCRLLKGRTPPPPFLTLFTFTVPRDYQPPSHLFRNCLTLSKKGEISLTPDLCTQVDGDVATERSQQKPRLNTLT